MRSGDLHVITSIPLLRASQSATINLTDWGPDVRDAPSIAALKRDRDYKRVEKCSADEFEPSLTAFDRMLDALVIR